MTEDVPRRTCVSLAVLLVVHTSAKWSAGGILNFRYSNMAVGSG